MNKKILISVLFLLVMCFTSCSRRNDFFNDKELKKFWLEFLVEPDNFSNYYNKSNSFMLECYMTVSKDDDVINYVLNILDN